MSAVRRPWSDLEDGWSGDETWAEFGDVVRDASSTLHQFEETAYGSDFWKEVVKLGWHSAYVDEKFGGLGLDGAAMAEIVDPLGVAGSSHAYLPTAFEAVSLLNSLPSERADVLQTAIADGDMRLQVAVAERADEPFPIVPATRIERETSGWRLTGRKTLVPYAEAADGFLVSASDNDGSCALVFVGAGTEGLSIIARDSAGLPLYDVVLDNVSVPDSGFIGVGTAVSTGLESTLDLAVALDAVALVAIGSEALALTLTYARERIVFDRPLEALQAVQHHCANAYLRINQMRVLTRDALDTGRDVVERASAASMAKVKAGEGIIEVMRYAHRVHGGIGFYDDYPLAELTRRAVAVQGLHGSVDWHRGRLQSLLTDPANSLERGVLRVAVSSDGRAPGM